MLDINHPLSDAVFFASGIEDKIRVHLLLWSTQLSSQADATCGPIVLTSLIPTLHALNTTRFNKAPGITATLNALQSAIEANDYPRSWECFLELAERSGKHNFGTWAI